ncbi:MAG: hypothetical protein JXA22_06515 [Candidatus Thermoplasmatota archaeon]|nr:hypothetical protein [Candidatus Thermoplasmatota archaeon]
MTPSIVIDTTPARDPGPQLDRLISSTVMRGSSLGSIMGAVGTVSNLIFSGARGPPLRSPLEMEGFTPSQVEFLTDVALTRKRSQRKFTRASELYFTSEGLRWATPEVAADHCASRLARELVIDVTCGQGGQVMSLSATSKRVIAVDIDPTNCLVTMMNCMARNISNVTIVNGDCFDNAVLEMVEAGCAVFCDPARPPNSEKRELSEIVPDPRRVQHSYGGLASGFCYEMPPYISMDKIDFPCEAEYVSIEGRLNRLNLYTGDLYACERSAVALPGGHVLEGRPDPAASKVTHKEISGTYAYEIDPTVIRADLVQTLVDSVGPGAHVLTLDERRALLFSDHHLESPFLIQGFRVISAHVSEEELLSALGRIGAGSVTIRYSVDPRDYWDVRRSFEEKLKGRRKVQLFKDGGFLVLEKLH